MEYTGKVEITTFEYKELILKEKELEEVKDLYNKAVDSALEYDREIHLLKKGFAERIVATAYSGYTLADDSKLINGFNCKLLKEEIDYLYSLGWTAIEINDMILERIRLNKEEKENEQQSN